MKHNDPLIRRVWCIGHVVPTAIKRKALDVPNSTYQLLGNVGLHGDKFNAEIYRMLAHISGSLRKIENV